MRLELPEAKRLELCRPIGVSYRQISTKPSKPWNGVIQEKRVIAGIRQEDIARLYLGLTLARGRRRQRGLNEIESGMRGINNFLDYINQAQRFNIGQFWDVDRDIRRAIQSDLAMISARMSTGKDSLRITEWLGYGWSKKAIWPGARRLSKTIGDSAGSPNR